MYIMQIIASAINKLDILYDFKTAVMMGVFVLVVSFLLYEYGNRAILFFYRLVNVFIWLNFLSVIFLYGRGIARDSYDTAIYFWSTKNHIISLTIVYLVIIFYLYTIIYHDNQEPEYMGNKNFLKTNEKEQLLKYVPEIRKLFKDDLLEGKSALLEWSFAVSCDVNKNPAGDEYLVFYEARTIK